MECTLNRFTLLPTASDAANFQAASGYTSCQLSPSGNSGAAIGGESEPVPVTCTDFYCHVVGVGPIAWLRAVQYTSLTWLSVSGEVQTSPHATILLPLPLTKDLAVYAESSSSSPMTTQTKKTCQYYPFVANVVVRNSVSKLCHV